MANFPDAAHVVLVDPSTGAAYAAGGGSGGSTDVSALAKDSTVAKDASLASILAKLTSDPSTATGVAAVKTSTDAITAQLQDITASATLSALNANLATGTATANSTIAITPAGRDTLLFQIVGAYVGTLSVQGTVDGTNWVTIGGNAVLNMNTGLGTATVPANTVGIFQFGAGGFLQVRVTFSAYTSGTPVVSLRATTNNSLVGIDSALPAGTNSIGAVTIGSGTVTTVGAVTTITNALPAGTNAIGKTTPVTPSRLQVTGTASTNSSNIKASAGVLYTMTVSNTTAVTAYIKLFDKASAATLGTDTPVFQLPIAANNIAVVDFGAMGQVFTTGISIATTTTGTLLASDALANAGVQILGSYI